MNIEDDDMIGVEPLVDAIIRNPGMTVCIRKSVLLLLLLFFQNIWPGDMNAIGYIGC